MDPGRLWTASLRAIPQGDAITRMMAAALSAVEPGAAVRRVLRRDGDTLYAGERSFDLRTIDRVLVVGAGKAGAPMAHAVADLLGPRLDVGLVVVKDGHLSGPAPHAIELVEAGHPVPDARGVAAAHRLAALLQGLSARDLVIVLISGGGSALLTLPAPGLSLADMQALTAELLACGASIGEINSLRKHLETLKGGGLARLAYPAAMVTLILSDVVGNPLDVIASGPTVADPSSFADAWAVLERYTLSARLPAAIVTHLRAGLAGAVPETPKPGDPALAGVTNLLVGSNQLAAAAAMATAQAAGFQTLLLTTSLEGEAREAGRFLASVLREIATSGQPLPRPACLIAGGETTVTLRGAGQGGRNQELALAAAMALAGLPAVAIAALATDGGDGPTDAAGAIATGETVARARALGLDPAAHLARNDAYPFFAALDDLLRTGPTATNVNDLTLLFAW
ncbi:MAG: glycerate kinase [Chloroflexi bacterium]|nr:glycerate kinase [Chloroflexota bacterium]